MNKSLPSRRGDIGITIALTDCMTHRRLSSPLPTDDRCLLRWVLQRGSDALTCEVDAHGRRSFDLQVMLGGARSPALTEHFDSPVAAVERHAQVATLLRDAGWVVTTHTPGSSAPSTA